MKTFLTKHYEIENDKLYGTPLKMAFLTDMHGVSYGQGNHMLLSAIRSEKPDLILITGDMINRTDVESYRIAEDLLTLLAAEFPVYYALGNHEYKDCLEQLPAYFEYERNLKKAGVRFLHNEKVVLKKKNNRVALYGLELPLIYFKKMFAPKPSAEVLEELIGKPDPDTYTILLAHDPKYGKKYFTWGADLVLCGHYHGGMVRVAKNIGLISPHVHILPRFCYGKFSKSEQTILVSAGLGEHSVPIRINNPRELVIVTVKS